MKSNCCITILRVVEREVNSMWVRLQAPSRSQLESYREALYDLCRERTGRWGTLSLSWYQTFILFHTQGLHGTATRQQRAVSGGEEGLGG